MLKVQATRSMHGVQNLDQEGAGRVDVMEMDDDQSQSQSPGVDQIGTRSSQYMDGTPPRRKVSTILKWIDV